MMQLVPLLKKASNGLIVLSALMFCIPVQAQDQSAFELALAPCILNQADNEYISAFKTPAENQSFSDNYEAVQEKYHQDINKKFNEYFAQISGNTDETTAPENICAPFKHEKQTSVASIRADLNAQHKKYKCALLQMAKDPKITDGSTTLLDGISNLRTQEYRYLKEIEDSYAAQEMTIEIYEQVRMWYPVHRDLQCLIDDLGKYNTQVRTFIDRVIYIPQKFFNYGSKKQV